MPFHTVLEVASVPPWQVKAKGSNKMGKTYNSNSANMALISSDDRLFNVHLARMKSISYVPPYCIVLMSRRLLGAAFVNSSKETLPNRVCLTNSRTENSQVLKVALDIIYTHSISSKLIQEESNTVRYVIEFAKEWEIPMIIDVIRKRLRTDIESGSDTSTLFNQFLVALDCGDNELAARYYASPERAEWSPQEGTEGSDVSSDDEMDMDEEEEDKEEREGKEGKESAVDKGKGVGASGHEDKVSNGKGYRANKQTKEPDDNASFSRTHPNGTTVSKEHKKKMTKKANPSVPEHDNARLYSPPPTPTSFRVPAVESDDDSDEESIQFRSGQSFRQYGLPNELPDYHLSDNPLPGLQKFHPLTACPGGDIFDLSIIPYDEFLRIPSNIVWCIFRAQRIHQESQGDSEEIDGSIMEKLLDLACEFAVKAVADGSSTS